MRIPSLIYVFIFLFAHSSAFAMQLSNGGENRNAVSAAPPILTTLAQSNSSSSSSSSSGLVDMSIIAPLAIPIGSSSVFTPTVATATSALSSSSSSSNSNAEPELISASMKGDFSRVQLLLENGADVNVTDRDGQTALMYAAYNGHTDVVQLLLGREADVNAKDRDGCTALIYVAEGNYPYATSKSLVYIASLLINKGADVNAANYEGRTTFMIAANSGRANMIEQLLAAGVNVDAIHEMDQRITFMTTKVKNRGTASRALIRGGTDWDVKDLMWAAAGGYYEVVKVLLEKGINIDTPDQNGWTALMFAAASGHANVIEQLLAAGANVDAINNMDQRTALMVAKARNRGAAAGALIRGGADCGVEDLMWAAKNGHCEVVEALLKRGINIDAPDQNDWTALIWAAAFGYANIIKQLLAAGANDAIRNMDQRTALMEAKARNRGAAAGALIRGGADCGVEDLMWAAKNGHCEVVEALLKRGININTPDQNGWTALMEAKARNHTAVAGALIRGGADCGVEDLMWAATGGYCEVVEALLERGINIDAPDQNDWTALMYAAYNGHADVVQLLLDSGAYVNARNLAGQTALIAAKSRNHGAVAGALIRGGADWNVEDLMWAVTNGYYGMIEVLLARGINIDATDEYGFTALMNAALYSRVEAVEFLIAKGARADIALDNGATAFTLILPSPDQQVIESLIQAALDEEDDEND